MKAYGSHHGHELEYRDLGAPSRHRKSRSVVRKSGRRILHKLARREASRAILKDSSN